MENDKIKKKNRRIYKYLTYPAGIVCGFLVAIIAKKVFALDMDQLQAQLTVGVLALVSMIATTGIFQHFVKERYS